MANSKHFLGYARLGAEVTGMKADYREQYDVSVFLGVQVNSELIVSQVRDRSPCTGT